MCRNSKNSFRAFFLLTSYVVLASLASSFVPAYADTIQVGIEHKEFLPPVPQQYKSGTSFAAPAPAAKVTWFPVPEWMAGTWLKEGDTETYLRDFRTGQEMRRPIWMNNRVQLSFGHQRDALGTVWHAEILPFRADGNRGNNTTDKRYVMDISCLNSSPQTVALGFRSLIVVVNPNTNRINNTDQQEEIVTFRPAASPGLLDTSSSTKTFDENGQPLLQLASNTERKKLADFMPVNQLNGINLTESLFEFLAANNMSNRIPR